MESVWKENIKQMELICFSKQSSIKKCQQLNAADCFDLIYFCCKRNILLHHDSGQGEQNRQVWVPFQLKVFCFIIT